MSSTSEALERLIEGNRRFAAGKSDGAFVAPEKIRELASGQSPFAAILGCSDSRVPAEIIFDQGLGDLFVIRVAGNVVAQSQAGSVEFAVESLGVALVVVLGHTGCGAVRATLDSLEHPGESLSPNLNSIVDLIRPVVSAAKQSVPAQSRDALLKHVVRANVHASVARLQRASPALEGLIESGKLDVVGAEYSLKTGLVEILAVPDQLEGAATDMKFPGPGLG